MDDRKSVKRNLSVKSPKKELNVAVIPEKKSSSTAPLISTHEKHKFIPLVSGEIPLFVNMGTCAPESNYPISFAVPFPVGAVRNILNLRLVSDNGSAVPAQFSPNVKWPDGSFKAVLLTFYPEKNGTAYRDYKVLYGNSVHSLGQDSSKSIKVVEDADSITIDTGTTRFQMSRNRFALFDQVYRGAANERVLREPGDLTAIDNKTGKLFRSSLYKKSDGYRLEVVEKGALRTVVRAEGKLRGENGAVTADGDRDLATFRIWLTFYANSGMTHLKYTIIDTKVRPGIASSFPQPVFSLSDNRMILPLTASDMSYVVGGEAGAIYEGKVTGEKHILQDAIRGKDQKTKGYSYKFHYTGVGNGERAPGWMDVSSERGGVTVALRYFWQNYPMKLSINDRGNLNICLQPEDALAPFSTDYPGEAKTHDIFINFHEGGYTSDIKGKAELYLSSPVLLASSEWYKKTVVFGPLGELSDKTWAWDKKVARQYECSAFARGCSKYPVLYGKNDFGDYQLGYDTCKSGDWSVNKGLNHYEDAHGWILEFLRQGEKDYFDFAAPFAMNHYDIGVMHTENPFYYPGVPAGMIHWHGGNEKIEGGHIVPGGIDEYYLLTADPRALEVIREQADWIVHKVTNGWLRMAPEIPGDKIGLEEYERPHAWPLYTVLKAFESTGDLKYWNAATIMIQNAIDWWKLPQHIIVFQYGKMLDPKVPASDQAMYYEMTDWIKGNGYWVSTLRTANCDQTNLPLSMYDYQDHVPIAWMAAYLETAIIRYYEQLKIMGGNYSATITYRGKPKKFSIDAAAIREMIIQTVNVIVDHNYVSNKYPSIFPWLSHLGYDHFVYSACPERSPKVSDGAVQMPFVLLYASGFTENEISERWRPTWKARQGKWRDIARTLYRSEIENRGQPLTGYNGAPLLWNMPYAIELFQKYDLL
ncbi:MAG: hypothetical protein PHD01_00885 [Geobacteraceae bacterium]|nr:hypothetical protein [Geobacteraceae bacterium]